MEQNTRPLKIDRQTLKKGDRFVEMRVGQGVLTRGNGMWGCDCTEWTWDCDFGPNGDVWCTKVCVKYECTPVPSMMG
jgi:hypothetical protein